MTHGFIARDRELDLLERFLQRKRASVAVVYGRRRIGKTELIRKALEGRPALIMEGLENQPTSEQIRNFMFQLSVRTQTTNDPTITTWQAALHRLHQVVSSSPRVIVLDEFQWMANYRRQMVAHLKLVWDQFLSSIAGLKLILCGSIASFMTRRVVQSSAMYGRSDLTIHLREFHLGDTRQMLDQLGLDEVLEAQMTVGGVPKYLDLLRDHPSVRLAVEELAFRPDGFLTQEYARIFTSHFGEDSEYERIITALAAHPYGLQRKQLAKLASLDLGGGLTRKLQDLDQAGFIALAAPFDRGVKTKTIKYHLSDAYLRFYFAFVQPNLRRIGQGARNLFARICQTGAYHAWRGRAFEYVCLAHAQRLAELLGFSGIDFDFGPYFRSAGRDTDGVQVDLVFDRADNVITLCEMKASQKPVGTGIIPEVERKASLLAARFPRKTIQRVLVLHGQPTSDLLASGYFYRIICAEELA